MYVTTSRLHAGGQANRAAGSPSGLAALRAALRPRTNTLTRRPSSDAAGPSNRGIVRLTTGSYSV